MSYSAVNHFHKDSIERVIASYAGALPVTLNEDYHLDGDTSKQIGDIVAGIIKDEHHNIVRASAVKIAEYLQDYGIQPLNGVDEFKISYFVGEALTIILSNRLAGKVAIVGTILNAIQHISVKQLDYCIGDGRCAEGRASLKERIVAKIDQGKAKEHFGKYGIYIAYKACSNTANGK